jgi:hypothetical protein
VYRFRAEVWLYQGENPWHFLTLPADVSDAIEERAAAGRRGFGSVRVEVAIGGTRWSTSVFPDKAAGAYVLPLKAAVRRAEGITAGDSVSGDLEVVEAGGGDHP